MAKAREANNLLGIHILNEYDVDYKLISSKVKKAVTVKYKNIDNMYIQLEKIRGIIIEQTYKDVCLDKMIVLCVQSRALRCI